MGSEHNCLVVWTYFSTALPWNWDEDWPFPVLWPLLGSPNMLTLGAALYGTKGGGFLYSAKKMFIFRQLLLLTSQWSHHDKELGECWVVLSHMWVFSRSSGTGWLCTFRSLRQIFSSVQSLSHVRLFATPGTAACQASLSITNSGSWLQLMSLELVMPSNHLILCCPLLLLPLIFPSIRICSSKLASGGKSIGA